MGVTERMEESLCLLFLTLGMKESEMPQHRLKVPRPITVSEEGEGRRVAVRVVLGLLNMCLRFERDGFEAHRVGALVRGDGIEVD